MTDFVFNIAKGRVNELCAMALANDALIAVPIETTGLESDATLKDYDNLSVLLAASNNEQTTMGRKTLASVAVAVDDTNDRQEADFANPVWTAPAVSNAVSKLIICYDNDTTGGSDTNIIPLTAHDWVVTPNGMDITANVNSAGFFRAT